MAIEMQWNLYIMDTLGPAIIALLERFPALLGIPLSTTIISMR